MSRAPSVCLEPGCPELVPGGGRCDAHRRTARRASDHRRPNATARGYDARWRKFRKRYLAIHQICIDCGERASELDHLDGLGPNGPSGYDESNIAARCHDCHSARTARDQPGGWHGRHND